jgi:uracil-DNA glycosylase family 4
VKSLQELGKKIRECTVCEISNNTKNKTIGKGSKNPDLLFVGLNPGREENETGVPFVGPSGKLLDKWMKYLGLDNRNCAVINLVKCYTPNASLLNGDEIENCRPFYDAQVKLLNPKIIIALGAEVFRELTGSKEPMMRAAGKFYGNVFAMPHPSYFVRKGGYGWEEYLKNLRDNLYPDTGGKVPQKYAPLHCHSEYSVTDGAGRLADLVQYAVDLKFPAMALTDHGTIAGWYEFSQVCLEKGIKPIFGVEFYVTTGYELKDKMRYHLVALAKNKEGLDNIFKLNTIAHVDGFYYKPRITLEDVIKYKEGLVILSACTIGVVTRRLLDGDVDDAYEVAKTLRNEFGDDFYLELQPHYEYDEQHVANEFIIKMADELGIKLVVTTDVHYKNTEAKELHNALKAIGFRKKYGEVSFTGDTHCLLDTSELQDAAGKVQVPQERLQIAMDNTLEVAEKCNAELKGYDTVIPKFSVGEEE